jgi:NAD+ synthase (glutamine-hydrolysing)
MLKDIKISVHQMNTVTGDLDGNTNKIINCLKNDSTENVDLSIFPETTISGYMCGSLWDKIDFVKNQQKKLKEIKDYRKSLGMNGVVVLGFVKFHGTKKNGFPILTNSVAVIDNSGIRTYSKQILADADHHEDKKYFIPGTETKVFKVNLPNTGEVTIGTPICEDSWIIDHHRDIPREMVEMGAEILIIPNQSYFYYGKQEKRVSLFSKVSRFNDVPVITINAVGVGDILKNIVIFDGGSMVFNSNGRLLKELPRFEECDSIFTMKDLNPISFKEDNKYKEITNAIVFEQKEFFRLCGLKKAQVHISGGLDSAIVTYLVQKAMGKENTVLITNPSSLNTKSLEYVKRLTQNLSMEYFTNPIEEIYQKIIEVHTESFGGELSDTGKASIQAVLRTVQGLAATHQFSSGIVSTGNHTEIVLGWASFHDIGSIGVHAIIGDLTKVELYELSSYINEVEGREIISVDLFNGLFKPAAELPDAMEDPIDYWVQSGICAALIRDRKTKDDLVWDYLNHSLNTDYFPKMDEVYKYDEKSWISQLGFAISKMRISVYKAAQAAPIVIISPRSRGFSNRETLINKYRDNNIYT